MVQFQVQELIPGLPDDLALECLTRVHSTTHQAAASVCRGWRRLLGSSEYYHHRKQNGRTSQVACLIQATFGPRTEPNTAGPPSFGLTFFDLKTRTWERLDSMPGYPNGLPLYCQVASSEGKLVIMGGWDPVSFNPMSHVFICDLMTRKWKKGQDMPAKRSLFAIGAINGRILVAGGHDPDKNASDLAWVYDVVDDKWTELTKMSEERDECQGLVFGPELWVISGYNTEAQGEFKSNADVYNIETRRWKRVEDIWVLGQNPRSCVGFGPKGELINWGKPNSLALPGKCVDLGDEVIVYNDLTPGFLLVHKEKHAIANADCNVVEKLDVPMRKRKNQCPDDEAMMPVRKLVSDESSLFIFYKSLDDERKKDFVINLIHSDLPPSH
ncbi:hypothetical protein Cgig2_012199 [Carnegiea gigantea]|uniref:F-box domain-containing protein n=1 Tax=Carnegiea gigantea TaxID=171969 RepID=A0A9Q1KT26_9CARY|nr:hypothetical protein Cgig2_012199 [Carnegiea gigantea]